MRLVLCDRDEARLDEVAAALDTETPRPSQHDVSQIADVERLRETAYRAFGQVAVLMNNAAISGAGSDNWTGLDAWRQIIDVNLWGVVNGVHVFAAAMQAQGTRAV